MEKSLTELFEESEQIEADPDAVAVVNEVRMTRGHGRVRVLQVWLNDDEFARLSDVAKMRHLPVSTLARSVLLTALDVA